jgi:hypothetical protein
MEPACLPPALSFPKSPQSEAGWWHPWGCRRLQWQRKDYPLPISPAPTIERCQRTWNGEADATGPQDSGFPAHWIISGPTDCVLCAFGQTAESSEIQTVYAWSLALV